ncbi:hypothetical protein FRC08_007042 [Ceratobasidium sp. 394]|nr:hypothetical protein FRC08_007042 [Ceratobasidium sp. 394]
MDATLYKCELAASIVSPIDSGHILLLALHAYTCLFAGIAMSERPIRSKTGCLTCKTRKKKCDEVKPLCNRCARAGIECLGYSYLDNPEELTQARAKVASRSSAARSIATASTFDARQHIITSFPVGVDSDDHVGRDPHSARSHSVPSGIPSSSFAAYDTDFGGASYAVYNVPLGASDLPFTPQHVGPGYMRGDRPRARASWGGSRNASAFRGSVLPEGFTSQVQSATQAGSPGAIGPADQTFLDDLHMAARRYPSDGSSLVGGVSESRMSSLSLSDEALYDCDSESTDWSGRENITEIVCRTSSSAREENESLPYVLQCYTNWMLETVFEPIRSADLMRRHIIERFMASEESRTTLISIANVVRSIGKSPSLTPDQVSGIRTLRTRVHQTITVFNANEPHIFEQGTYLATKTLSCALELLPVHLAASRFGTTISLLREAAPAFKRVVPEPPGHPINLPSKLVFPNSDVRQYSALDVLTSLGTGWSMSFPYDVSNANLPLGTSNVFDAADALGLQWMYGCPVEFIVLLARMHNIRDTPAYVVEAPELGEIESAIRDWRPRCSLPEESHLAVARLAMYEFWRQALLIYLFMGVGRAASNDTSVARAHKSFMKLFKVVYPGRVSDRFLLLLFFVAAVASHKEQDRNKVYERIRSIDECRLPGTAAGDVAAMVIDIWGRADSENRAIFWSDVRIAFHHVTGL